MTLVQQIRSVLAQLELVSHGTTANWSPTGAGGVADSRPPTGEVKPPHLYWRERWERAVFEDLEEEQVAATTVTHHRRRVIKRAQAELDSLRKQPKATVVGETEEGLERRIIRDGEGEPIDRVALAMRCTPTFVGRARLKAGRNVETGRAPKDAPLDSPDEVERVRQLKAEGFTERGIRMVLKIGGSKLQRLLREAA